METNLKTIALKTIFLNTCLKYGIKKVCVCVPHPSVPMSTTFGFGTMGSVFSERLHTKWGWPAIWQVCEDLKIGAGCGNGMQHQISLDAQSKLEHGCFHHINGEWKKID